MNCKHILWLALLRIHRVLSKYSRTACNESIAYGYTLAQYVEEKKLRVKSKFLALAKRAHKA